MRTMLEYDISPTSGLLGLVIKDNNGNDLMFTSKFAYIWKYLTQPEVDTIMNNLDRSSYISIGHSLSEQLSQYVNLVVTRTNGILTCPCCGSSIPVFNSNGYCVNIECTGFNVKQSIESKLYILLGDDARYVNIDMILFSLFNGNNDLSLNGIIQVIQLLISSNGEYGIDPNRVKYALINMSIEQAIRMVKIPELIEEEVLDFVERLPQEVTLFSVIDDVFNVFEKEYLVNHYFKYVRFTNSTSFAILQGYKNIFSRSINHIRDRVIY